MTRYPVVEDLWDYKNPKDCSENKSTARISKQVFAYKTKIIAIPDNYYV